MNKGKKPFPPREIIVCNFLVSSSFLAYKNNVDKWKLLAHQSQWLWKISPAIICNYFSGQDWIDCRPLCVCFSIAVGLCATWDWSEEEEICWFYSSWWWRWWLKWALWRFSSVDSTLFNENKKNETTVTQIKCLLKRGNAQTSENKCQRWQSSLYGAVMLLSASFTTDSLWF